MTTTRFVHPLHLANKILETGFTKNRFICMVNKLCVCLPAICGLSLADVSQLAKNKPRRQIDTKAGRASSAPEYLMQLIVEIKELGN
jgi:hypothetical protein